MYTLKTLFYLTTSYHHQKWCHLYRYICIIILYLFSHIFINIQIYYCIVNGAIYTGMYMNICIYACVCMVKHMYIFIFKYINTSINMYVNTYICIFYYLYVDSLTYAIGWHAFLCRIRFCDILSL
jgi:hypothetical protein